MSFPVLSTSSLRGDAVRNPQGENIGKIEDFMINAVNGSIAYAVVSSRGFPGLGDKCYAIPWCVFAIDAENKTVILDVDKDTLKKAPGFDKERWPDMADSVWADTIAEYYCALHRSESTQGCPTGR